MSRRDPWQMLAVSIVPPLPGSVDGLLAADAQLAGAAHLAIGGRRIRRRRTRSQADASGDERGVRALIPAGWDTGRHVESRGCAHAELERVPAFIRQAVPAIESAQGDADRP